MTRDNWYSDGLRGVAVVVIVGAMALAIGLHSQQVTPAEDRKGGAKGGFRPPNITAVVETDFEPIFDGSSLQGWDGDPAFWRVENGALVGQTLADRQPKQNTFLIYRGATPANFELRLDYRLTGHNSGIQVRSREHEDAKWGMYGYQADIDRERRYAGQWYEERGRGFLALRGQYTWISLEGKPGLVATLGDDEQLKGLIHVDDWNSLHITARGSTLTQVVNGRLMSMLMDDDVKGRKLDGLIGIQCHTGPPMKIEVKNVRLKRL